MARGTSPKNSGGGGPARIRLVILEAEAPDGDLTQLTTAVQNALRSPENAPARKSITAIPPRNSAPNDRSEPDETVDVEMHDAEDNGGAEQDGSRQVRQAVSKPRRPPRTPKVLDLDLTSGVPFEEFARAKSPSSDHKRYLVVAAWFKLHRQTEAITTDHVYTCYRAVKWPSNIVDFNQPLRDLKGRQLMTSGAKGQYSINHLGLAEVDKLNTET